MEPIESIEEKLLQEAVENGREVKIICINGHQTPAQIVDFDYEAIVAKADGKTWMVYRHAVSTIVFD